MTETLTAPLTPGIQGVKWFVHEVTGGLAEVRGDLLKDVPEELRQQQAGGLKVDGWQVAGRFAYIGTPYAEMDNPDMTKEERREARVRSAHMLSYVGFMSQAVALSHGDRQDTAYFLNDAHDALAHGDTSPRISAMSPFQAAVLKYGRTLHQRLGFDQDSAWSMAINQRFVYLNSDLLDQLAESAPGRRDPEQLFQIAVNAGRICVEIAALAAAMPKDMAKFSRFLQAASAFGGIGFLHDQMTRVTFGRMETYASARIRKEKDSSGHLSLAGVRRGMRAALAMRKEAEASLVHEGMAALAPGRERETFGSQVWFLKPVYLAQRTVSRLSGRDKRLARQLQ